jgi:predicted dehydrogenase
MESDSKVRVAVVGLGKMGLLHASLLSAMPEVKLCAVCDKSKLILRISKKIFRDVQVVDDLQKLAGLNIDAVHVTTPIPSHHPIARMLYSQRIAGNLFVEKTLATNYDGAKELCSLAEDFGGVNMVGYMKRFSVTFRKAKDLLDKHVLGEVESFEAYAFSSDFSDVRQGSQVAGARGGVLEDLGSHVLDVALWFFGDLQIGSAKLESLISSGSEDTASFDVKGSGGVEGHFDMSWCKRDYRMPEFGLVIHGSNGVMNVDDDGLRLEVSKGQSGKWYRHDLGDSVRFLLGGPEYSREDEYFIKSVLGKTNAEPSFLTASKVDYVIEQVRRKAGGK